MPLEKLLAFRSPSIEVVSSGAPASESNPNKPDEEDDRGDDPQEMRGESQSKKQQDQKQCQQYDHFLNPFASMRSIS